MAAEPKISRDQEEANVRQLAVQWQVPYVDGRSLTDPNNIVGVMSSEDIRTYNITPIRATPVRIDFGLNPSSDLGRIQFLKQKFPNFQTNFYLISQSSYNDVLSAIDSMSLVQNSAKPIGEFTSFLQSVPAGEIFRYVVERAYLMRSSDIHIEPKKDDIIFRFRIDGALHHVFSLPISMYKTFISAVQISAKMSWGVDRPQGGRMNIGLIDQAGQRVNLDLRLESIPTLHGEEIIVRLLTIDPVFLTLDSVGFSKDQMNIINQVVERPQGMILVVGPTGSGKTSLLYGLIKEINKPEIKVVTLEDPIEFELEDASQVPVNSEDKESFTEKLRAVLRQDPNVIMLGEVRDTDTAKTALQAALTGHLVLSTFHANTTASAISRLMDMIGRNPLVPSALRVVIAKRLVRKICENCKESYAPDEKTATEIKSSLEGLPAEVYSPSKQIELYKGKGCEKCNGFGYLGRISLVEVMHVSSAMEELLTKDGLSATTHAIEELARKEGMITIMQDGLLKALAGLTTIEEVHQSVTG